MRRRLVSTNDGQGRVERVVTGLLSGVARVGVILHGLLDGAFGGNQSGILSLGNHIRETVVDRVHGVTEIVEHLGQGRGIGGGVIKVGTSGTEL